MNTKVSPSKRKTLAGHPDPSIEDRSLRRIIHHFSTRINLCHFIESPESTVSPFESTYVIASNHPYQPPVSPESTYVILPYHPNHPNHPSNQPMSFHRITRITRTSLNRINLTQNRINLCHFFESTESTESYAINQIKLSFLLKIENQSGWSSIEKYSVTNQLNWLIFNLIWLIR